MYICKTNKQTNKNTTCSSIIKKKYKLIYIIYIAIKIS